MRRSSWLFPTVCFHMLTFPHCVFSYVSPKCLFEKIHCHTRHSNEANNWPFVDFKTLAIQSCKVGQIFLWMLETSAVWRVQHWATIWSTNPRVEAESRQSSKSSEDGFHTSRQATQVRLNIIITWTGWGWSLKVKCLCPTFSRCFTEAHGMVEGVGV